MNPEEQVLPEELRRKVDALDDRDFQLWSILVLLILVVTAGFLALIFPNVAWRAEALRLDGRYVPQLFFGFIVLIVLFNIYALGQRRLLRKTRRELFRQLARSEAAEKLALVDPLTEIYNRRYLDQVLPKEVNRAERRGTSLTFLVIDVDGFKSVNTRFGHLAGDRLLSQMGQLLLATFRRSDIPIRYGGDEFLIVMPETNDAQAQRAVERLLAKVEDWNKESTIPGFRLILSFGLATYVPGTNVADVLARADQRMYLHKAAHAGAP
jgi:diguanylate cyclase (GGDEF)-like protein